MVTDIEVPSVPRGAGPSTSTSSRGTSSGAGDSRAAGPDPAGSAVGDGVRVRAASERDLPRILDLLALSMGGESHASRPAYWNWKHVLNPFGSSPCLVAEAGDDVVGVRVFMRWKWRSGATDHLAVRAVDTATHPDWRRRGIFSRLTRALLERCEQRGVAFVFNTPNSRSRPGYLKMGWQEVERAALLVRPQRPLRVLRAGFRALAGREGVAGSAALPMRGAETAADLFASRAFPELVAPRRERDERYHTVRSPGYLRWRYELVPFPEYGAVWVEEPVGAAVVFRVKQRLGLRELSICELLRSPEPGASQATSRVLRKLVETVDADYVVACAVADSPEREVLLRSGFLPARVLGPTLVVRPLAVPTTAPDPTAPASWRYGIGDLELF